MAVDFASRVYIPVYDVFARSVTFTPLVSQPGQQPYTGRGIYGTNSLEVLAEDNTIISDQRTILDIIEAEFAIRPAQGDLVSVADYGDFMIIDASSNDTETTFTLRRTT